MTRFRMRSTARLWARCALVLAAIAAAGVLAGCASSTEATAVGSAAAAGISTASAEPAEKPLALHLATGSYSVSVPGTTISGTVSRGASVAVNGRRVTVHSGHWRDRAHLHIGRNTFEVEATMQGRAPARRVIHVVRHHSAAELEALAHARALRVEAEHRHESEARERKERQQQTECPNGTYENSAGNIVCKPYESPSQPAGATARCEDGTYSFSESRSGTCSHHGGVAIWLDE
jgi:Protein of unknown function (DUF3761)/Glucodextranase, domain B